MLPTILPLLDQGKDNLLMIILREAFYCDISWYFSEVIIITLRGNYPSKKSPTQQQKK